MPYVDLNTIQNPTTGVAAVAAWGDGGRDSLQALAAPPTVRAQRSTIQSIPDATNTGIAADALTYDSHTIHTVVGGVSRFTVPTNWAGEWDLAANTNWQANNVNKRSLFIRLNGTLVIAGVSDPVGFDGYMQQYVATTWDAVAGDYFEFFVNQDSGAALNLEPLDYAFQVIRARWIRLAASVAG